MVLMKKKNTNEVKEEELCLENYTDLTGKNQEHNSKIIKSLSNYRFNYGITRL